MKNLFRLIKICDGHNVKNVRKGYEFNQDQKQMIERLDDELQELVEAQNVEAQIEELCDVISIALHILANMKTITGSIGYNELERICLVKLLYRFDCSTLVAEMKDFSSKYKLTPEQEDLYPFVIATHDKIEKMGREDKEGWRKLL